MATLQELESAIEAVLSGLSGYQTFDLVQREEEKAYEAYVLALCLTSIRNLGGRPILRVILGKPNPFIFRGGPGLIHSQNRNYGYVFFTLNSLNFEIHVD